MNFIKKLFHKAQPHTFISITHNEFKQLLYKEITPKMLKYGFQYDGQYTWYSEIQNNMRKSVSVCLLKGASAIFRWSVTFDFIPFPSGNRLTYSKTEKKILPHLFEYPNDYYKSFESEADSLIWRRSSCKMTQMGNGIQEIIESINTAFLYDLKKYENWHNEFITINDAIRMASAKINSDGKPLYPFFYPSPLYILSFLLAATDKKEEGKDLLRHYLSSENHWSEEIKEKITQKFDKIDKLH